MMVWNKSFSNIEPQYLILFTCAFILLVGCTKHPVEGNEAVANITDAQTIFASLEPDISLLEAKVGELEYKQDYQIGATTGNGAPIDHYEIQLAKSFPRNYGKNVQPPYKDLISMNLKIGIRENVDFPVFRLPLDEYHLSPQDPLIPNFTYATSIEHKVDDHHHACITIKGDPSNYVQRSQVDEFAFCTISFKIRNVGYVLEVYVHDEYISAVEIDKLIIDLVISYYECDECQTYRAGQS